MGDSNNGFSDREAGRIERRLISLEDSVETVADKMDEFVDKEYNEVKKKVNRHRTWLKVIWGLIGSIGSGIMSFAVWLFRGKFGG